MSKRAEINVGTTPAKWTVVDNIVLNDGRIFIPAFSMFWPQVPALAHDT
jgi:hypothetical protein